MRHVTMIALVAAQVFAAAPGMAADIPGDGVREGVRMGTFAGARIRIPLDRAPGHRLRAGLTVAPTLRGTRPNASSSLRIGQGVELGMSGSRAPELSLNGKPLARIADRGKAGPKPGSNLSPIGWAAIGVGVAAVAYLTWFFIEMGDCDDHDDEC